MENENIRILKEQIELLQQKKDRLVDLYLQGDIDKCSYKRAAQKLDVDIVALQDEVKELNPAKYNKTKGVKTGNYAVSIQDVQAISNYMINHQMMINLLHVTLQVNTGRRVSDLLNLKWSDLIDDDHFRKDIKVFREKKTGKEVQVHITEPVKWVVRKYSQSIGYTVKDLASLTGDQAYIFYQWTGTHRGRIISQKALNEAVRKVGVAVGIKENVTTHALRRGFGMMLRQLHQDDPNCMEILRGIFKHSSVEMTAKYIGLTKKNEDQYYESLGDLYTNIVLENSSGKDKDKVEREEGCLQRFQPDDRLSEIGCNFAHPYC